MNSFTVVYLGVGRSFDVLDVLDILKDISESFVFTVRLINIYLITRTRCCSGDYYSVLNTVFVFVFVFQCLSEDAESVSLIKLLYLSHIHLSLLV